MTMLSAIFTGHVVHRRFQPREHRLRYNVFSLLLDLDELQELERSHRLFGYNRFAVFSFHDADHGETDNRAPLKAWVLGKLEPAGLETEGVRVSVLCYPRILGFVFNPLTVYFCHRADGALLAILYEVCNTFGERHTYVVPATGGQNQIRQSCSKALYVSPFMPMDCEYHFLIETPGETVAVRINETTAGERVLYAAFEGVRAPFGDMALLRLLVTYPAMTLKVVVAIHWEALRLWLKGLRIFRHERASTPIAHSIVETKRGTRHG